MKKYSQNSQTRERDIILYKNRIKRYEMMEYKISTENVKDTTSKVLEIMENQND